MSIGESKDKTSTKKRKAAADGSSEDEQRSISGMRQSYFTSGTGYGGGRDDVSNFFTFKWKKGSASCIC